jgi:hypothetical protein
METNMHGDSTLPFWCAMMAGWMPAPWNGWAIHVVSRRVALGFRSRIDLTSSVQFTVHTLAGIEGGVRKAGAGTYAMLENKLAWAVAYRPQTCRRGLIPVRLSAPVPAPGPAKVSIETTKTPPEQGFRVVRRQGFEPRTR